MNDKMNPQELSEFKSRCLKAMSSEIEIACADEYAALLSDEADCDVTGTSPSHLFELVKLVEIERENPKPSKSELAAAKAEAAAAKAAAKAAKAAADAQTVEDAAAAKKAAEEAAEEAAAADAQATADAQALADKAAADKAAADAAAAAPPADAAPAAPVEPPMAAAAPASKKK